MKTKRTFTNLLLKAILLCVGWLIVALLVSTMTFLNHVQGNYSLTLSPFNVILFEVICIIPWVICTPVIVWATWKYSFGENSMLKLFSVHLLIIIVIFSFHSVIQSYAVFIFYGDNFTWEYVQGDLIRFLDMRLLLYAGVVIGTYAFDFQRKNRESKLIIPQLKAQLNDAKFHALLNQIQPAFLLNSIDDIRKKVKSSPRESEVTLTRFSDLLRVMLQNANREEIPIQKDLESYHMYLDLLEKRLATTIEKKTEIDQECYEAMVPAYLIYLMLILLIEEMMIVDATLLQGLSTCYSVHRVNKKIHLQIRIEGVELASTNITSYLSRTHFEDTKQRLQQKYDETLELKIEQVGNAIQTSLQLPYKMHRVDASSRDKIYAGNHLNGQVLSD